MDEQNASAGSAPDKKALLKKLIRGLHEGVTPERAREEFSALLQAIGPTDVARAEEELIEEGMPREEVQRLCDVHLAVLRESLAQEPEATAGHPVDILTAEHTRLLELIGELVAAAGALAVGTGDGAERLGRIADDLRESESHYLREENVLFPYLEKHGITQPPAIMWMEHDQIRPLKKEVRALVEAYAGASGEEGARRLAARAADLRGLLESHFYKENNILFPAALQVVEADEWVEIQREFDELGYPSFSADLRPRTAAPAVPSSDSAGAFASGERVALETGSLSPAELEGIFGVLPVELTFVDADDRVRFFSNQKERIFVRTKAALGREVRQCHPQKSLHLVERILSEFRAGKRDQAEFWLPVNERLIHIRFFAVRDPDGRYLGCLEVTQDITDIQKITGQKRLL